MIFDMGHHEENGAAGEIRTPDPLVRSQVLYPTELQPQAAKCSDFCGRVPSEISQVHESML
jgi:hypothetical protein